MAFPLYRNLHWLELPLRRYVLLRRSRSVVEQRLGGGTVPRAVTIAADLGLRAHGALLAGYRKLRARGLEVVPLDPAQLFDSPWKSTADERVAGHRSPEWYDWILRSSFESGVDIRRGLFEVRDREANRIAYFLVKSRFYPSASQLRFENLRLGSLQDWTILDADMLGIDDIVMLAAAELARWHVDAVEVCLGDDVHDAHLRRLGFARVGNMSHFVGAAAASTLADSRYTSGSHWQLRPAEGDHFFS
jgi:hypothetical protein